jgi:hypothetical protein
MLQALGGARIGGKAGLADLTAVLFFANCATVGHDLAVLPQQRAQGTSRRSLKVQGAAASQSAAVSIR